MRKQKKLLKIKMIILKKKKNLKLVIKKPRNFIQKLKRSIKKMRQKPIN